MKLLMIQPPHAFVDSTLPPVPGGGGLAYPIKRCRHCGIMGYTTDGLHVHLFHTPGNRELALTCAEANREGVPAWFVRITCPHLCTRGPAFHHLKLGTMHRVLPPPDTDPLTLQGLWVHGPHEPVKVLPGEFLPMQVRTRRRIKSVAVSERHDEAHAVRG